MYKSDLELTIEQRLALEEVEQCFSNITRIRTEKTRQEQLKIIKHIDQILDKYCEREPAYSVAQ